MRRWIKNIAVTMLGLVILLAVFPEVFQVLLVVLVVMFGWIGAAGRIGSTLTTTPGALEWAAMAMLLILAGTHSFCSWCWRRSREIVAGTEKRQESRWPWRWTFMLHAALALVLFASMSVVGVAHQTAWLIASQERFFVLPSRLARLTDQADMRELALEFDGSAARAHWDLASTRIAVGNYFRKYPEMNDRFHTLLIEGTNGRLARALIFPRNRTNSVLTGIIVLEPESAFRTEPAAALSNLLQRQLASADPTRDQP